MYAMFQILNPAFIIFMNKGGGGIQKKEAPIEFQFRRTLFTFLFATDLINLMDSFIFLVQIIALFYLPGSPGNLVSKILDRKYHIRQ